MRARLMVQQEAARALARARRAGDHHHRRALRVGAGDRVDEVERAGAVGDDRNAEAAVVARRRVGREADAPARGSACSAAGFALSSITLKNGSTKSPGMPNSSRAP